MFCYSESRHRPDEAVLFSDNDGPYDCTISIKGATSTGPAVGNRLHQSPNHIVWTSHIVTNCHLASKTKTGSLCLCLAATHVTCCRIVSNTHGFRASVLQLQALYVGGREPAGTSSLLHPPLFTYCKFSSHSEAESSNSVC